MEHVWGRVPGGRGQEGVTMEVRRHWPREAWALGRNGQERTKMGKKARGGELRPEARRWEGRTPRALDSGGRASEEACS